ncbi:protein P80 [Folsomia candida]|uniref:Copper transport protein n=1 Tax=Folsomia candida TaxID=158441 RepID=A0A226DS60_FOLCA|nr:protein P80 [Folsomia candida]XP_035711998.1 protein P80 [Folsomia candida]OXA48365.1 High affinity copper uptake protein 1 [Folsomia candida]
MNYITCTIFLIPLLVAISVQGLDYGATCTPLNDACYTERHLACNATTLKCTCASDTLAVDRNGVCTATYGAPCASDAGINSTQYCNRDRYLGCTGDRCACRNPSTQVFDVIRNACSLTVGQEGCAMNPTEFSLNCVHDAFCEMIMDGSTMVHRCIECVNFDSETYTCLDVPSEMEHGMAMWFHTGTDETVLFKFWKTEKTGWFVLSLVIIFAMAFSYEGLKHWRDVLFRKHAHSSKSASILTGFHIAQTCLHIAQFVLSYFLMLIFMTYNVWLAMAVTLGAGAGYFCFGWNSMSADRSDHCS